MTNEQRTGNEIYLMERIPDVKNRIAEKLKQDDFASKLTLDSLRSHLVDLERQLRGIQGERALSLCVEWMGLCDKLDNEQDDCMREYYYGLKNELMDRFYNLGLEAQKAGEE